VLSEGSRTDDRRRALEDGCFGFLPVLVTGFALLTALSDGWAAGDFRHSFLVAAWRALHGRDVYAWTPANMRAGLSFPYPALTVLALEPLVALPARLASLTAILVCIACVLATLRMMSVRDWRLYGVVLLWSPVVIAWQTGNVTLPLVLGSALAWRHRDRPLVAGVVVALLISLKPIMFPLGLWLLATRRYRAAGYAVGSGVVINLLAWTVIGWHAFGQWLHLLSVQSRVMYRTSYSIISLSAHLGAGRTAGTVLEVLVALLLAGCVAVVARRHQDRGAFGLAIGMTLIASPQTDVHYFAVLIVPLTLARPRLSWVWLAPLALWLCPATDPATWQIVVWWLAATVVLREALRGEVMLPVPMVARGHRTQAMGGLVR
jgi:hypothetical protein